MGVVAVVDEEEVAMSGAAILFAIIATLAYLARGRFTSDWRYYMAIALLCAVLAVANEIKEAQN